MSEPTTVELLARTWRIAEDVEAVAQAGGTARGVGSLALAVRHLANAVERIRAQVEAGE